MEFKWADIEFKAEDVTPTGAFAGWGAITGTEDFGGDTILPGAMKKSLKRMQPKIYLEHHSSVGVYDVAEEKGKGLWVEGFPDESRDGLDARAKVISGALDRLSVGYETVKAKETGRFKRDLLEIKVFHVGLVPFGMHDDARITAVKARDIEGITTIRDLERLLRDAGISIKAARMVCAPGFVASLQQRDSVDDDVAEVLEAIKAATDTIRG